MAIAPVTEKIILMPDNKNSLAKPIKDRINLSELYEIKDWSKRFAVHRDELRRAVREVWKNCKDYEQLFQRKKGKGNNSQAGIPNLS